MSYRSVSYTNNDYLILLLDSYYNHRAVIQEHLLRQRKIAEDNYIKPEEFYQKLDEICYSLEIELKRNYYHLKKDEPSLDLINTPLNLFNISNGLFVVNIHKEEIELIRKEIEMSKMQYKYDMSILDVENKKKEYVKGLEIELLNSNIKNTKAQKQTIYWIAIGTIVSALATTVQALVSFRSLTVRNTFVVYSVYSVVFLFGLIAGVIIYMLISEGISRRKREY